MAHILAVDDEPAMLQLIRRVLDALDHLRLALKQSLSKQWHADTGKGFSGKALKHATEQFFMDDDSRNSKTHYGIGLYVADSIAKKHNGKMILENSPAAGGARVTIQIPY